MFEVVKLIERARSALTQAEQGERRRKQVSFARLAIGLPCHPCTVLSRVLACASERARISSNRMPKPDSKRCLHARTLF